MQFIFLLLCLFAIGCVLYGLSVGVQTIARGLSRLAGSSGLQAAHQAASRPCAAPAAVAAAAPASPAAAAPRPIPNPQPIPRCADELQALFGLYQRGALTRQEFDAFKRQLLSALSP
jgi:hypothetical protein